MRLDLFGWLGGFNIMGTDARNVVASFEEPIYERRFEQGERLYQFVRNVSATDPFIRTGRYFALAGATTEGLAIFDGASGRTLKRYVVIHPFTTIEGTARDREKVALEARARGDKNKDGSPIYATDWTLGLAGRGGGTQIFVPYPLLGHLRGEGTEDRRPYEWFKD